MKRNLIKSVLIMMVIGSVALPAAAAGTFGIKAVYLMPGEQAFKDIYGSGLMYGAEIGFKISGPVGLWLEGMYFKKTGELSYTKEETSLTLMPIGAGIRYDFTPGPLLAYAGAGGRFYSYKEKSDALGEATKSGFGFVGFAGASYRIAKGFLIDVRAGYSYCKLTPADFSVNVGGFELGGGLVIEF